MTALLLQKPSGVHDGRHAIGMHRHAPAGRGGHDPDPQLQRGRGGRGPPADVTVRHGGDRQAVRLPPEVGGGDSVEEGGGVPHRARDGELGDRSVDDVAEIGAEGDPPPTGFQSDQSARAGGQADRSAPVVAVRHRHDAGGHRRRRASSRSERCALQSPRVVSRTIRKRFGRRQQAQLGRIGAAEIDQPGAPETIDQAGIGGFAKVERRDSGDTLVKRIAGAVGDEVLDEKRDTCQRPWRRGFCFRSGPVEAIVDNGVESGIALFQPSEGGIDEFCRRDFAGGDRRRLTGSVEIKDVLNHLDTPPKDRGERTSAPPRSMAAAAGPRGAPGPQPKGTRSGASPVRLRAKW